MRFGRRFTSTSQSGGPRSFVGARCDRAICAVLVVAVLAGAYVGLRLVKLQGDPSRFVCAGDVFCDPRLVPPGLHVHPSSSGYDGQFYYRLALDPFTRQAIAFGIELDLPPYRHQRILYPLIAWLVSLGQPAALPIALIGVNYIALLGLAWFAARLAQRAGEHALAGLVVALYPGFVLTLGRDATEIVAACLLAGGLLLVHLLFERSSPGALGYGLAEPRRGDDDPRTPDTDAMTSATRGRWRLAWGAGALFALAVLARETALGVPIALGIAMAWRWARRRQRDAAHALVALIPGCVFVAWQATLAGTWGAWPVLSRPDNVGPLFAGAKSFVLELARGRSGLPLSDGFIPVYVGGMAVLALLAIRRNTYAGRVSGDHGGPPQAHTSRPAPLAGPLGAAWALYLYLGLHLSRDVWVEDWAIYRALTELHLAAAMLLLTSGRRVWTAGLVLNVVGWLLMVRFHRAL